MKLKEDLSGKKQHKITVIKQAQRPAHLKMSGSYWFYKCNCGETGIAHRTTIVRGLQSCGCINKQKHYKTKSKKHYRKLYSVWRAMHYRCYREHNKHYKHYGARGIKICKRWHDFGQFYNDVIDQYKPGLSIERKDIDKDYKPSNCIWIPFKEQAKNRRSSLKYRKEKNYDWPYAKK